MTQLFPYLPIKAIKSYPVPGGDINQTYRVEAEEGNYFLKVNDAAKYPQLFEKEARGIEALAKTKAVNTPTILTTGEAEGLQYLLAEFTQPATATPQSQLEFGRQLATMHKQPQEYFGLAEDNYLGTWLQPNTPAKSWCEFYAERRILPLIKALNNKGDFAITVDASERFCGEIDNIFPVEKPALLHGDLWGGNYITIANDVTVLIDPAVYYGHREMDIAMSRLFGGFSQQFYEGYNEVYPLQPGWEGRQKYAQLYPLLFHAWAFGGGYVNRVKNILAEF